jgi:hypothetical protein
MQVQRDVFARGEYLRFTYANSTRSLSCLWCGQKQKRLYSYVWWNDGKREPEDNEQYFCNFGCFQAYNS